MTSWEDVRSSGIAAARNARAELRNQIETLAAFAIWWNERLAVGTEGSRQLHLHPSTIHLASKLRDQGLDMAADFATTQWTAEGPIHPGVWMFSILLGESFVTQFIDSLIADVWRPPNFYGLENSGAWETYDRLLRDVLRTDQNGVAAVTKRLAELVARITKEPSKSISHPAHRRGHIENLVMQYAASPSIKEAWGNPIDDLFFSEESFLWDILLEVEPADTLALLGKMPHPIFMRCGLQNDILAKYPDRLAELLKSAPVAFSDGGKFRVEGAIAVLLLDLASSAVRQTAIDADGSIRLVPVDEPELLIPATEQCKATTQALLSALFTRADAIPLAWEWLERLISNGKLVGRWPTGSEGRVGLALNQPMILIFGLAERLSLRSDWKEWISDSESPWRVHRAMATFAVDMSTQPPNKRRLAETLERALIENELEYLGIADAMSDTMDIVALVGGRALCTLDDPASWFDATWEKLRPIREQNWHVGEGRRKQNRTAELLVLWGFAAYEELSRSERQRFWMSLENAIRDARQTDAFIHAPIWTEAFLRLFSYILIDENDGGEPIERSLARALRPYIAAENGFFALVTSLVERSWPVDVIRNAVHIAGFDLKCLMQQFLSMKEFTFGRPPSNQEELKKLDALLNSLR